MSLLFLFGLPATGKTFVGNVLQNNFDYVFHDGDVHIPADMTEALNKNQPVTENMRDRFIANLLAAAAQLKIEHTKIVIAQTFIKDRHRQLALQKFPDAKFILVETSDLIREKRLVNRRTNPIDPEYAKQMVNNFDTPTIPYVTIQNNWDGEEKIIEQLTLFFHG